MSRTLKYIPKILFSVVLNLMLKTEQNKYVNKTNEIGIACHVLPWEFFKFEQMLY
jgi:hypothetical protein